MKLIYADSAINEISRFDGYLDDDMIFRLQLALKKLPAIDAVPVIRCNDCKFYVEHSLFGVTQGWCERLCDEFDRSMARGTEKDDFCSHGKKKVTK